MENLTNLTLPPTKIPNHTTLVLHLLKTEIKHHTLTNAFDKLGMDTTMYTTNLGGVILGLCGVEERTDELLQWYYKKLDEYVDDNLNSETDLSELTMNFYTDIITKIKKQSRGPA